MSLWGTGILNGLRITFRNLLRGPITTQYPRERVELPERARWAVQMKADENGNHKCTACIACERACPDYIIKIDVTTGEDKKKHIDRWNYEVGACMMCGLCVEACPFDAIEMGHDYELATPDVDKLAVLLLEDTDAAQPKRKERPAAAAKPGAVPVEGDRPRTSDERAPAVDAPPAPDVEVKPGAEDVTTADLPDKEAADA